MKTKGARFRAAQAAQSAGETTVTLNRIVEGFDVQAIRAALECP